MVRWTKFACQSTTLAPANITSLECTVTNAQRAFSIFLCAKVIISNTFTRCKFLYLTSDQFTNAMGKVWLLMCAILTLESVPALKDLLEIVVPSAHRDTLAILSARDALAVVLELLMMYVHVFFIEGQLSYLRVFKVCDPVTGECFCGNKFSGRSCDDCKAGFFGFPQCQGAILLTMFPAFIWCELTVFIHRM